MAMIVQYLLLFTVIEAIALDLCNDGDVRLVGGSHYREGVVEVCRQQQWGRVCDDFWDVKESAVVCRQLGLTSGVVTGRASPFNGSILPIVLDDLGCNGTESNLLECLPTHNCRPEEYAGVRCLRKGVSLEMSHSQLLNNTLLQPDTEVALICATDSQSCCVADSVNNWHLPNGTMIGPEESNGTLNVSVSRQNQTLALLFNNELEFATGIYFCVIADEDNNTNFLYVGIYPPQGGGLLRSLSLVYDKINHTIICTSIGGPVTTVTWSKDNSTIDINATLTIYDHSQIITNRINAVYENRLRILHKSSMAAGMYRCTVANSRGGSHAELHVEVCRDMEVRFQTDLHSNSPRVEVCSDDQWYALDSTINADNSLLQIIQTNPSTNSVAFEWKLVILDLSVVRVTTVDISCSAPATDGHLMTIIKTYVVKENTTMTYVNLDGLFHNTVYNCCLTIHYLTTLPLEHKVKNCSSLKTFSDTRQGLRRGNLIVTGIGIVLGILGVVIILLMVLITYIAILSWCKQNRTIANEHQIYANRNDLCDAEYEPHVDENVAYGASHQEVPVNENVAYDTAHNQVLLRENVAYGTSANEVPMNENTAYGISTTDDGPVNNDVEYW